MTKCQFFIKKSVRLLKTIASMLRTLNGVKNVKSMQKGYNDEILKFQIDSNLFQNDWKSFLRAKKLGIS